MSKLPLQRQVERTIVRHDMLPVESSVLVAVSGGSDSVALLFLLHELTQKLRFSIAGVAHFNHQLREGAADEDEAFCAELASSLGLPFDAGRGDVRGRARVEQRSIEDAARHVRYEYLRNAAGRLGATRIATGHTRDDQAETVLMRLMRGAGSRGLAAILPVSGDIVRPCLDVTRSDLRQHLAERGVSYREDATNADESLLRNRIRHVVLPRLSEEFPGAIDVLARHSELARADELFLDAQAKAASQGLVMKCERGARVGAAELRRLPLALSRRIVRDILNDMADGRFQGFDHISSVLDLVDRTTGSIDLPGARVELESGHLVFTKTEPGSRGSSRTAAEDFRAQPGTSFDYLMSVPGEVLVSEANCLVVAELHNQPGSPPFREGSAMLDADHVGSLVHVRSRRPGDLFRPLGSIGRKKLQDFFVDRKVARLHRDLVPLVVRNDGQILWVGGHAIAHDFRVTASTRAVVTLKLKPLGGSA